MVNLMEYCISLGLRFLRSTTTVATALIVALLFVGCDSASTVVSPEADAQTGTEISDEEIREKAIAAGMNPDLIDYDFTRAADAKILITKEMTLDDQKKAAIQAKWPDLYAAATADDAPLLTVDQILDARQSTRTEKFSGYICGPYDPICGCLYYVCYTPPVYVPPTPPEPEPYEPQKEDAQIRMDGSTDFTRFSYLKSEKIYVGQELGYGARGTSYTTMDIIDLNTGETLLGEFLSKRLYTARVYLKTDFRGGFSGNVGNLGSGPQDFSGTPGDFWFENTELKSHSREFKNNSASTYTVYGTSTHRAEADITAPLDEGLGWGNFTLRSGTKNTFAQTSI